MCVCVRDGACESERLSPSLDVTWIAVITQWLRMLLLNAKYNLLVLHSKVAKWESFYHYTSYML